MYHIVYFLVISKYIGGDTGANALNRATSPKTNHNTNPTYRNYPTNPN